MMEWWPLWVTLWCLVGLGTWVGVVMVAREVTRGDLFVLPLCVMFGGITLLLLLMAKADDRHSVWRW